MNLKHLLVAVSPLLMVSICAGDVGDLISVIPNPSPSSFACFGSQVAVNNSYIFASAPRADKIYVLNEQSKAVVRTLNNPGSGTGFGSAMSVQGDVVAVGDYTGRSVYVFSGSTGQLQQTFTQSTVQDYGYTTAIVGNYLAVGCYSQPDIYVYDLTTGNLAATCHDPVTDSAYFGRTISECGPGRLLVGHAGYDAAGTTNSGAAYLYEVATGALLHTYYPDTTVPAPGAGYKEFGISVGHIGGDPLISCWGTAYRFSGDTGELLWTSTQNARSFFVAVGDDIVAAHQSTAVLLAGDTGDSLLTVSTALVEGDHYISGVAAHGKNVLLGDSYTRYYWPAGGFGQSVGQVYEYQVIPEPATLSLLVLGGLAVLRARKSRPNLK